MIKRIYCTVAKEISQAFRISGNKRVNLIFVSTFKCNPLNVNTVRKEVKNLNKLKTLTVLILNEKASKALTFQRF